MYIIYAYLYNWGSSRAHLMSVPPLHGQRWLPRPCQTRPLTHTLLIVIRKQKHCQLDSCVRTLAKVNIAWFKYRVHIIMIRHYFFFKSHCNVLELCPTKYLIKFYVISLFTYSTDIKTLIFVIGRDWSRLCPNEASGTPHYLHTHDA